MTTVRVNLPPVLVTASILGAHRYEDEVSARLTGKRLARLGYPVLVENRTTGDVFAFLPSVANDFGWIEARGEEGRRLYREALPCPRP